MRTANSRLPTGRVIGALIAVMFITIFQSVAWFQLFNVNPVWIQQHVAPDIGGFRIPIPWYQSLSSVFGILGVPLLLWIWRRQSMRGREPGDLAKIEIGPWLTAASNLILVAAIAGSGGLLVVLSGHRLGQPLEPTPLRPER